MQFVSCRRNFTQEMEIVLHNAFYDTVQYGLGMTLCYIFIILMTIEIIYVMAKYLGGDKK